jgi:hypothetical protein
MGSERETMALHGPPGLQLVESDVDACLPKALEGAVEPVAPHPRFEIAQLASCPLE